MSISRHIHKKCSLPVKDLVSGFASCMRVDELFVSLTQMTCHHSQKCSTKLVFTTSGPHSIRWRKSIIFSLPSHQYYRTYSSFFVISFHWQAMTRKLSLTQAQQKHYHYDDTLAFTHHVIFHVDLSAMVLVHEFILVMHLTSLSADASCKLNILGHDGCTFGVNGTKIYVFE